MSYDIYFKMLYALLFSFLIAELSIGISQNPTLETSIATIIGAFLSFLIFQIMKFFLKKFLEKKLSYNEFSYIKAGSAIVFPHLLGLILTFSFMFMSIAANNEEDLLIKQWHLIGVNPFFWIFTGNIFLFTLRVPMMKQKLIALQKAFKEN